MKLVKGIITVGSFVVAIVVGALVAAAVVVVAIRLVVGDILGYRKRKPEKTTAGGNGKLQDRHTVKPFK